MRSAVRDRPARAGLAAIYLGLLVIITGCPDDPAGGGIAEVGTGTTSFDALATNQELVLIAGPQGGHHFILHARIADLAAGDPERPGQPGNPSTVFAVVFEGERVDLPRPALEFGYEETGDGFSTLISGRIVQVLEAQVEAMHGQPVTVAVTVTDAEGRRATDERVIIAAPDPEEN